ncbi:PilZ domain-containing protein [Methylophaga sulfidovorans]|uniref:PilZ domain-containing protein n=1 Tax=Methylophaga sulfidovorans TaxID=45496 RepID=A0A1I3WXB7_9GAMM|nr:PilZ domain-containing protein [Methylophaga sulfidovorans]SFK12043.1 PilZ domain-containing protein [Methylophaga sulfidovorans]
MAESADLKQKNQAFLQGLEKQRLNKDCLRIIDLRGKVSGECQAYEFGGRRHYLDDRAYLLVKQLMNRTQGRYTVAVYEAVLKTIKQLEQTNTLEESSESEQPAIQRLILDESFSRTEQRLNYSTPVKLRIADVLYSGHTVNISLTAIRVTIKRSYTLHTGDSVMVEFSELSEKHRQSFLSVQRYQILKLEHDEAYSTLILTQENTDAEFVQWMSDFIEQQAKQRHIDTEYELLNLQKAFYHRLWVNHLAYPVLWQVQHADYPDYQAIFCSVEAEWQTQHWQTSLTSLIESLPVPEQKQQEKLLILIGNKQVCFSPLKSDKQVSALLNHAAMNHQHLFLMLRSQIQIDDSLSATSISALKELMPGYGQQLENNLNCPQYAIRLIDLQQSLTPSLSDANKGMPNQPECYDIPLWELNDLPTPYALSHIIKRQVQRYQIHTPVIVHINEQQYETTSVDVSSHGLSVGLPLSIEVTLDKVVYVDFPRWQSQTKKVSLQRIPYQLKNKKRWKNQYQLGFERIHEHCSSSQDQFFNHVIASNQQQLKQNQDDVIQRHESRLFLPALLDTAESIPLFLGVDESGQRRISIVGCTELNNASQKSDNFWLSIEVHLAELHEQVKGFQAKEGESLNTALYGFESSQDQWQWMFDHQFIAQRDKDRFLQRALAAKQFYAFQCYISPISRREADKQTDLLPQLNQQRSKQAHRIKHIRRQLSELFAIAELTDITQLIQLMYANSSVAERIP